MTTSVHPTALVDPRARLAPGVEIGPYAVIGPEVEIGEGSRIGPHVVIDGRVRMGKGNRIFPGACIGLEPQDLKYGGAPTEVVMGDENTIRECVTINRATAEGERTVLGNGNLLMAYSHIGHNCQLSDRIVIANGVAVAGHVVIGERAVIGGVLGIHQFVHIGSLAMVGGMSRIDRDVPPFMTVEGHPGRIRGLNRVGLRRSGMAQLDDGAQFRQLQDLWTLIYRSDLVLAAALRQARERPLLAAADELCAFLEASVGPGRRGPLPAQR
ncbi:acyl-ACP--UDP-N-acetylglucosamine O-acyltransferase [Microcystis elabens FACHB-917]|jgi:UDP-N-acetylglucosamine acyltransferase|uniref:Acyl-[acyl-carrier-protein]--UDP-N-acetylglucosamine O-acyltransferase n=2 Tax=Cyanophyceae TaxID=3028117 RepID=A0ABX5F963_9CHRO|nr:MULTISPECIES: acyl-ACP--UDP-N-acetylglucosamine O-acyltransferase [Cyanophyceae]MBD2549980.1 acyl-ACP--UDP-N-acetylglucosamine O-acyltransferase [Microcystis elabens FACHB-917]MCP9797053.1 acyl-ACP--UDP-N-acetylglucosamine O-acyltransferase [Cyanobium sp. Lug-B]MEA5390963.1 acyl-ACP--UDP-N-acetylglucosamine O-acyltransferase [Cyanobium gracile UHCC 0139]PSB38207.1 acyl-[acyl-carrier-protein]--UDP-N-acetylglucosamine O-acyltransferase [Aphanothece cf. minutissima CCALA 015]